ncbi:MAG: PEP/pyruvate-binding domain-containing protein [Saprospiraceae bacterium]
MRRLSAAFTCLFIFPFFSFSQKTLENTAIQSLIEKYKVEYRGPYRDIRWFCPDGTYAEPRSENLCKDMKNAVQRARYRDEVVSLGKTNHVFLGQILSATPKDDFWDAANYNSRLKQYQLEKYLRAVDDGWVLRLAQFYRGAYQVEDEEKWGIDFFNWLLAKDESAEKQFFLLRQAAKDIPHQGDDSRTQKVRAVSKAISEKYTQFNDLRVKIHGQPEQSDIAKVKAFKEKHAGKLTKALLDQLDELVADMEAVYKPVDLNTLNKYLKNIPKDSEIGQSLTAYIGTFSQPQPVAARVMATAEMLWQIRQQFLTVKGKKARLSLLDISNALEEVYFKDVAEWKTANASELMNKICYTGMAAAGTGYLENWEWEAVENDLAVPMADEISLAEMNAYLERSRGLVEWGTGMVRGVYRDVVNLYNGFEPLAYGFFDDRIRGSVLLNLGQSVTQLGDFIAKEANFSNQVMNIGNQSHARGLNPGYALGELVVVSESEDEVEVSKDKIYIFNRPPGDLKPVAGIATVTEGNMVSHVQLLARNLAIPNAVVSSQNLSDLKKYSGQKVFYAVSNRGTVIMKPADKMTAEEQKLFEVKKRSEERITVPVEKIELDKKSVLNMREVNAASSGKTCGPKAANLGQLKQFFPDNVVEGLVIPFGIFRQHMDLPMPDKGMSYWQFLNQVFQKAREMSKSGSTDEQVEAYTLGELEVLRNAIKQINLLPDFVADLKRSFYSAFGTEIGKVPVFLRSDTNMEDLKDFTGAGLNLTLFNVVDEAKILQGIKEVWASPYTERSFKWRQRYLLNPENVFPSILIIPSVDVDYSGVMITKGITTGDGRDQTIAFSWGAGGAVDGQAAESYLLRHDERNILLSPAREPTYRKLPASGGTDTKFATFEKFILNHGNVYDLRLLAYNLYQKFTEMRPPYDVECGFKDNKLWLFQVRPFVENKSALSSAYLESITPRVDGEKMVGLKKGL